MLRLAYSRRMLPSYVPFQHFTFLSSSWCWWENHLENLEPHNFGDGRSLVFSRAQCLRPMKDDEKIFLSAELTSGILRGQNSREFLGVFSCKTVPLNTVGYRRITHHPGEPQLDNFTAFSLKWGVLEFFKNISNRSIYASGIREKVRCWNRARGGYKPPHPLSPILPQAPPLYNFITCNPK